MSSIGSRAVKDWYDRLAGVYDRRWRRYLERCADEILDARPWSTGERILDVACGTGLLIERLSKRVPGIRAVGVDVSQAMLAQARAKRIEGLVDWVRGDARRLPLASGIFDAVVCNSALHYFPEPVEYLWEMHRVLRPGGSLVLVDWAREGWPMKLLDGRLRRRHPAYVRMYDLDECEALLVQTNFRLQEARRFRAGALWKLMLLVAAKRDP